MGHKNHYGKITWVRFKLFGLWEDFGFETGGNLVFRSLKPVRRMDRKVTAPVQNQV